MICEILLIFGLASNEVRQDGVTLARPAAAFSNDVQDKFREAHAALMAVHQPEQNETENNFMHIVQKLANASHIENFLRNPAKLEIRVAANGRGMPEAQMKAGVLTVNMTMLDMVKDQSELAAILGHEMLHHTLGHDLVVLKKAGGFWRRWLAGLMNFNVMPIIHETNFAREMVEFLDERTRDKNENEVDRALPKVLINAGFDPWAIVTLNARIYQYTLGLPPILIDGPTREKFRKRTLAIAEDLVKRGIPRTR